MGPCLFYVYVSHRSSGLIGMRKLAMVPLSLSPEYTCGFSRIYILGANLFGRDVQDSIHYDNTSGGTVKGEVLNVADKPKHKSILNIASSNRPVALSVLPFFLIFCYGFTSTLQPYQP